MVSTVVFMAGLAAGNETTVPLRWKTKKRPGIGWPGDLGDAHGRAQAEARERGLEVHGHRRRGGPRRRLAGGVGRPRVEAEEGAGTGNPPPPSPPPLLDEVLLPPLPPLPALPPGPVLSPPQPAKATERRTLKRREAC